MAGTWESQNKILPGAYLNFKTNAPLSITPGDRGVVVLLQEMSVGSVGEVYAVTALDNTYPEGVTVADKLLVNEILKGAQSVLVYNLGSAHTVQVITAALAALVTTNFNVLCYPYTGVGFTDNQLAISTWVKTMVANEGVGVHAVLASYIADSEAITNVSQGIVLSDDTTLTIAQTTAWVAGITAGANINQSNTGRKYLGAVDVVPRMTKSEMEAAITAGQFVLKVDKNQNVSVVYDINSFTTTTAEKGVQFTKNRIVRCVYGIKNDVSVIFESNYVGKINNNAEGRSLLRAALIEYFNELQRISAIQNFVPEDVTVSAGTASDAVVVDCYIQPVDAVEKIYITVNLS